MAILDDPIGALAVLDRGTTASKQFTNASAERPGGGIVRFSCEDLRQEINKMEKEFTGLMGLLESCLDDDDCTFEGQLYIQALIDGASAKLTALKRAYSRLNCGIANERSP